MTQYGADGGEGAGGEGKRSNNGGANGVVTCTLRSRRYHGLDDFGTPHITAMLAGREVDRQGVSPLSAKSNGNYGSAREARARPAWWRHAPA